MKKNYTIQNSPFIVPTDDGKIIKEHFGRASDGNSEISIAHILTNTPLSLKVKSSLLLKGTPLYWKQDNRLKLKKEREFSIPIHLQNLVST